jgi:hypothetical protein
MILTPHQPHFRIKVENFNFRIFPNPSFGIVEFYKDRKYKPVIADQSFLKKLRIIEI